MNELEPRGRSGLAYALVGQAEFDTVEAQMRAHRVRDDQSKLLDRAEDDDE